MIFKTISFKKCFIQLKNMRLCKQLFSSSEWKNIPFTPDIPDYLK